MEMMESNLFTLIQEATDMLLDRSKPEQDLIYAIAKMEPDLRTAIVLAYQNLQMENEHE